MAKSKLVKANQKIAESVVGGYKKIEEGAVGGFNKMAERFVDSFLTREGESVEDARARLAKEQKEREEADKAAFEERKAVSQIMVQKSMQRVKNAGAQTGKKAGME